MLNAQQRKYAREIHQGASNFHQRWITDLVKAADHGDEEAERILKLFLKYRRGTERTSVAYHKVMEDLAQTKIEGME